MMNELFCLNQIYQDLSGVRSILQFIESDLVILLWIVGIAAGIFCLVWLTLGVFSAILLIEIKKKVHAEIEEIYSKDIKKKIRTMERIAKHRIEKGGDIYEENKSYKVTTYKGFTIMVSDIRGRSVYYIKERDQLTFESVDETEDYIDLLTK